MAPPQNQSPATKRLVAAKDTIRTTKLSIDTTKKPIEKLEVEMDLLKARFLTPGRQLCDEIDSVCNKLTLILTICKILRPVPIVGFIISQVAARIENLGIEKKVRDVSKKVKDKFNQVSCPVDRPAVLALAMGALSHMACYSLGPGKAQSHAQTSEENP